MSVFSEENSEENHYFTVFFTSGENSEENHYFIVFFTSEENSEEKSQRSEIIFPTHEKKLEKHEVIPVRIEQRSVSDLLQVIEHHLEDFLSCLLSDF